MTIIEILNSFTTKFLEKISEKFAKKTDIPKSLPANGGNAATVNGKKVETDVPAGAVFTDTKSWGAITDKPTTFTPSSHTHGNADITAFDAAKLTGTVNIERLPPISATSVSWSGVTGKPTTFSPSTHGHAWADVTAKPSTYTPTVHKHTSADISDFEECTDADIDAIINGAFTE